MIAGSWERSWLFSRRPPERHSRVASFSVIFSALLHILAFNRFSSTFIGQNIPSVESKTQSPWIMENVQMDPKVASDAEVPSLFQPEAPVGQPPDAIRPVSREHPMDPVVQMRDTRPPPLLSESTPASEAPLPPALPDWSPRVNRLQIEKIIVSEADIQIPRRAVPDLARSSVAPDVSSLIPDPRWIPSPSNQETAQGPIPTLDRSTSVRGIPDSSAMAMGDALSKGPLGSWMDRMIGILEGDGSLEKNVRERSIDRFLALELYIYQPPEDSGVLYFKMVLHRDGPESLPVLPKDILYILDCSQSMSQPLLDQCKTGLQKALASLNQFDRFNIISFREDQASCFPTWSSAGPVERAQAAWFIEQLKSVGRTDLHRSLEHILTTAPDPSRPLMALVLSDGIPTLGLTDDFQILESFSGQNAGKTPVFAFGAGPRVNGFFLDFLSRRNRGDTQTALALDQVSGAVFRFNNEISRPVLFDLSTHFLGMEEQDIFPKKLTPLFLDRPLALVGRIPADAPEAAVRIAGRDSRGPRDMVYRLVWAKADRTAGSELAQEWASLKLASLLSNHMKTPTPETLLQIQNLCSEFELPIPYADRIGLTPAPAERFPETE